MQRHSNFFDYEKNNNRLLKALQENKQFATLVDTIVKKDAILLFPHDQSVALALSSLSNPSLFKRTPSPRGSAAPPIDFLQSHIAVVNQSNPHQFITMNGIRGIFSEDMNSVQILEGPPTGEECITFFEEPTRLFTYKNG